MSATPTPCSASTSSTSTPPKLAAHWRVTTHRTQTVDEYGVLFVNLFEMHGIDPEPGDAHHHLLGRAARRLHPAPGLRKLLPHRAALRRARHQDRHAGAGRQSHRARRRPPLRLHRRLRKIRRPLHRGRLRHRHQVRSHLRARRIPRRRHRSRPRPQRRRALLPRRPPQPRRHQATRQGHRHQHRRPPAERPLLRLHRPRRRHPRPHPRRAGPRSRASSPPAAWRA